MRYYDIAFDSCNIDASLEKRLGFEKIGVIPKDIGTVSADNRRPERNSRCIAYGSTGNLIGAASGGVAAVYLGEPNIDKKLMAALSENGTTLCLYISDVTSLYGLKRSRLLYKTGKLFAYADKQGIPVSLVTGAKSNSMLCSFMQIIELAKLFGVDESYARKSLGETNRRLLVEK